MAKERVDAQVEGLAELIDRVFHTVAAGLSSWEAARSGTGLFPGGVDLLEMELNLGPNQNFKLKLAGGPHSVRQEPLSGIEVAIEVNHGNVPVPPADSDFIAGIVFGETSSLLAAGGQANEDQMAQARAWIAEIACRRRSQAYQSFPANLAPAQKPDATQMQVPTTKKRWESCRAAMTAGSKSFATKDAKGEGKKQRHFFMWPSDDGQVPRPWESGEPGSDNWGFHNNGKIIARFGPFKTVNATVTPAGDDVYIYIYDGVA